VETLEEKKREELKLKTKKVEKIVISVFFIIIKFKFHPQSLFLIEDHVKEIEKTTAESNI
jgi:hypothetical protein